MPLLEKIEYPEKRFNSDEQFDQLYPTYIRALASRHWTPLNIAEKAAGFLASQNNARILDIGSGAGKFCLAAAYYQPAAFYYGVEQRKGLIRDAEIVKSLLHLENISFIHGNFTQLDFRNYDHFYFYNSFYENLAVSSKIDDSIEYSRELYNYYNHYLCKQLDQKPTGTKLVTFHSLEDEVPLAYRMVDADMNNLLKYYIKI